MRRCFRAGEPSVRDALRAVACSADRSATRDRRERYCNRRRCRWLSASRCPTTTGRWNSRFHRGKRRRGAFLVLCLSWCGVAAVGRSKFDLTFCHLREKWSRFALFFAIFFVRLCWCAFVLPRRERFLCAVEIGLHERHFGTFVTDGGIGTTKKRKRKHSRRKQSERCLKY